MYEQNSESEVEVIDRIRLHFIRKNSITPAKIAFLSSELFSILFLTNVVFIKFINCYLVDFS